MFRSSQSIRKMLHRESLNVRNPTNLNPHHQTHAKHKRHHNDSQIVIFIIGYHLDPKQ